MSGSPGSRLISMSKWHCGRSCAPIATEATARAARQGEETGQVGSQGRGWGGARATVDSRQPVATVQNGKTASPSRPEPPDFQVARTHTHSG